jgi:predicted nucleic acid-binding Zn ribbon protein
LRDRLAPPTLLAGVQRCWAEAVGEQIAQQAQPIADRDGTITVACSSSVWAGELDSMSKTLLAKVNEELPPEVSVSAFRFVAGGH